MARNRRLHKATRAKTKLLMRGDGMSKADRRNRARVRAADKASRRNPGDAS